MYQEWDKWKNILNSLYYLGGSSLLSPFIKFLFIFQGPPQILPLHELCPTPPVLPRNRVCALPQAPSTPASISSPPSPQPARAGARAGPSVFIICLQRLVMSDTPSAPWSVCRIHHFVSETVAPTERNRGAILEGSHEGTADRWARVCQGGAVQGRRGGCPGSRLCQGVLAV